VREKLKIFNHPKVIIAAVLSGICNTIGNAFVIMSYHQAAIAKTSSGALTSLMTSNVLLSYAFGRFYFKEKQVW